MSNDVNSRSTKVLEIIKAQGIKKQKEEYDIKSFIRILTPQEKSDFESIALESDKEKFINNVMLKRANLLKSKMGNISIDNKIVKDIMDINVDNLEDILTDKTPEALEAELSAGMNQIKNEYMTKIVGAYVTKRDKRKANGDLDMLITLDEREDIDKQVSRKLYANPVYKFSLVLINNAAGTISVFNDKSVESRRDYEVTKMAYCNEKGITPESFDKWQEYVRVSITNDCIEGENGFSNLPKFDAEWHKEAFRKFCKKVPDWKEGDLVYNSEFLIKLDEIDEKAMSTSRNQITGQIVKDFDEGQIKTNKFNSTEEDKALLRATGGLLAPSKTSPKAISSIEKRQKELFEKKKAKTVEPIIKEEIKEEIKDETWDIFTAYKNQNENGEVKEVETVEIVNETKPEVAQDVFDSTIDSIDEKSIPEVSVDEKVVEELSTPKKEVEDDGIIKVPNPDNKLKGFRDTEIEETILKKYSREPDTNILKQISNPKLRITAYKNSAVVNGFRLYLPYSGYDVIVKKLVDKSKLSYMLSMMDRIMDQDQLENFIEHETLKILFECLEFPNFTSVVSYKDFLKNLSEGDIPILMVAFAMTNIPEDEHGRIILSFKSLKCTDPNCNEFMPLNGIDMDLKDLFSKIYPMNLYKESSKQAMEFTNIYSAYRATKAGGIHYLDSTDEDGMCVYSAYYSKPTMYKMYTVDNKMAEANFLIVKDDLAEREEMYKELYGLDGLNDYLKDMTYTDYSERSAMLASNLSLLSNNSDDFSDLERESISDFIRDNMSQINIISKILETSSVKLVKLLNTCKFLDAVVVKTSDGTEITSIKDCQEELFETINISSQMPVKMINDLIDKTNKLGTTFTFEHENVYYTSEDVKSRIEKGYVHKFSPAENNNFIEYLKQTYPDMSEKGIEASVEDRKRNYEYLLEGRCICGNRSFYINYLSIVFFSICK